MCEEFPRGNVNFVQMKRTVRLSLILCWIAISANAQIAIDIISPTANQITGSIVEFQVKITSDFEVSNVTAAVQDKSVQLQFMPNSGLFQGQLDLSGLAEDSLIARITATDPYNNTQQKEIAFIYDSKPVITVISPIASPFTEPIFNIKAMCEDKGGSCEITVKGAVYQHHSVNTVDTIIDLSDKVGQTVTLQFFATDSRNQTDLKEIKLRVENISPYYKEIAVFDSQDSILDVRGERVITYGAGLQLHQLGDAQSVMIQDTIMNIDGLPAYSRDMARLSPDGVVFNLQRKLKYWKDGVVTSTSYYYDYKLNGNYLTYRNGGIHRIDLSTGEDILVTTDIDSKHFYHNVSEDGIVVWSHNKYYKDGTVTSFNPEGTLFHLQVNNKKIVYKRLDTGAKVLAVFNYDTVAVLSSPYTEGPPMTGYEIDDPSRPFLLKDDFIAFTDVKQAAEQVFLRDAAGEVKQLSFFSGNSSIEDLNERGDVMFVSGKNRYLTDKNGKLKLVGKDFGYARWNGDRWNLAVKNVLYEIDTSGVVLPGVSDINLENQISDEPVKFADALFNNAYTAVRQFVKIKIASLPENGTLYFNEQPVTVGQEIFRSQLSFLQYVADDYSSVTDEFAWNASDGFFYATNDAVMRISFSIINSVEETDLFKLVPFPNPTEDILNIELTNTSSNEILNIDICNAYGQQRTQVPFAPGTKSISVSLRGYPSGIYLLRLQGEKKIFTRKIIKL
jgi:hypothetical protein